MSDGRATAAGGLVARVAFGVMGVALFAGAAMTLWKLALDVSYPLPLDYGEGLSLDRVATTVRGGPLYPAVGEAPFVAWAYTPVYAWICTALARWLGPSFAAGRALSLAATVVAAAMVFAIARREGAPRRWGGAAALLFVGSSPVATWGALMRSDALGIAFGLAGAAAVAAGLPALFAGVLFALATLCKQSLFAALAGTCLYLAGCRRWRDLVWLLASFVGVTLAVSGWQMVATKGWYWIHVVTAHQKPFWSAGRLLVFAQDVLVRHGLLAAPIAVAGVLRPEARRLTLSNAYLLAAAISAVLAGKGGSDINYLLDLMAATAVAAGVAAHRVLAAPGGLVRQSALAASLAALFAVHVGLVDQVPSLACYRDPAPHLRQVVRILAEARWPVISDEPGLVAAAGKPLYLEPFEFTQMAEAGLWDPSPVVEALQQGRINVLALHFDPWDPRSRDPEGTWASGRFTDAMVGAIRSGYRVRQRLGETLVLRPLETRSRADISSEKNASLPLALSAGGRPSTLETAPSRAAPPSR